ncbi:asparagine synthase (glutamine-hydrolyzing) [Cylindrospermopsis raciborskii CENA303]|uniref:asparagine synthase (glutamine-hydrolyzing) n=1 Tax=Cylindrospermopsis raciborskii CENA303 TaxID=1170769 RepID=A0A1X4GIX6_9CYAN|nr:asparagine synthase (glutamine-hydrolyzing) [Cylindrospermopsis raciborskii]OSO97116.1 asparagine synthase (glutamine-hydrolyzing) [Cylindrospermopsis raciborskii CENA303]
MCGISGWWSFNRPLGKEFNIVGLTSGLSHRGPDGKSIISLDNDMLQLGHTRLSILDLSDSGKQPMSYAQGKFYITFNGEIYNFLELRQELVSLGHQFRSDSDTEVILASYVEWGEDCLFKFNGMWAFALWDSCKQRLFLSRDRFGVKPLFYLFDGQNFIFASELKAFMALHKEVKPDLDPEIISLFSNLESTSLTLLKGVKNLNASHSLILARYGQPHLKQWWRTSEHLIEVPSNYADQREQYRELFFDACKVRMRSDVPIGTALSGGMDSSSVICAMAEIQNSNGDLFHSRQASNWRKAFVLDYTGSTHSERHYAQEVINYVQAEPNFRELGLEKIEPEDLNRSIFALEAIQEPGLGPWLIYQQMRSQGIVVSLDGHGGDEQLAGYHFYCQAAFQDALWRWRGIGSFGDIQNVFNGLYDVADLPEGMSSQLPPSQLKVLFDFFRQGLREKVFSKPTLYQLLRQIKYLLNNRAFSFSKIATARTLPVGNRQSASIATTFLKKPKIKGYDYLNQVLYDDFHGGTLPVILRNFDRLSMSHGVEIRAPFLDYRLVTYAFSLPSSTKLGNGFTKRILRDAMHGFMPESIRTRKSKIGFASPMIKWIEAPLKDFVLDQVHSQIFLDCPIWDGKQVRERVVQAYRNFQPENVYKDWKYIQAHTLMQAFYQAY